MKIILAAILFIAPHLERSESIKYKVGQWAKVIHAMSQSQQIDPFLIIAIIKAESNFRTDQTSRTHDHGLMQLHVSRTTFAELRGREWLLKSPTLNIYLGVKHLNMFRKWHYRKCKPDHVWWRHYKWGFKRKFPNRKWANRVQANHNKLLKWFRTWQKKVTNNSTPTVFPVFLSYYEKNTEESELGLSK
jgi:hypothetical protein